MFYHLILISTTILFLKLNCVNGVRRLYEGDQCVSHTGMNGTCTNIISCPSALELVESNQSHGFVICSYYRFDQFVCCMDNLISKFNAGVPESGTRKAYQVCNFYEKNIPLRTADHIIGGNVTSAGDFPHMVAVAYKVGNILDFRCGGSLISKRYVLTAAHCIKSREDDMPHTARMGTINILPPLDDKNYRDYMIENSIRHPKHKRSLKYNDIALLRLANDVELSTYITPACLSTDITDLTGEVYGTGWGVINLSTKARAKTLMSASLDPLALDICNDTYLERKLDAIPNGIIETQLCAYDPAGKADTCEGDSGGPLQVGKVAGGIHTVVGVTSFGVSCGNAPGVYTRVLSYLDWIESIVWPDDATPLNQW